MNAPYQPPSFGPGGSTPVGRPYAPPQTETKAIVALVLAIAAWLPIVPFIGAVAALVLAGMAKRDILASRGALEGLGLVTAARVIAWLHLLFVVLLFVFVVLALLGVFAFSIFGHHVGG